MLELVGVGEVVFIMMPKEGGVEIDIGVEDISIDEVAYISELK